MTSWTAINIVVEGQLAMKRGSPDPFMHVHDVLHGPDELREIVDDGQSRGKARGGHKPEVVVERLFLYTH
jgi:hypothetical protein